jgi:hypothetical protein
MAVAYLLVGLPTPDRSKVMTQTKRDTIALWLGVGHGADNPTPPHKNMFS